MLQKRLKLDPAFVRLASEQINRRLISLLTTYLPPSPGKALGFYYAIKNEVDVSAPALWWDKTAHSGGKSNAIALPKIERAEMHFRQVKPTDLSALISTPESFSICEPSLSAALVLPEIILVPGLAFSKEGHRIGYGKGFFDRYFAKLIDHPPLKIGVCYQFQLLEKLSFEQHDFPMDYVVTEVSTIKI